MNRKIRQWIQGWLALCLLLSGWMGTMAAAPLDVRLQVKVTDCLTGLPIDGATVRATTSQAKEEKTVSYTNNKGYATIYPVQPGNMTHKVKISAPYYVTRTISQNMAANTTVVLEVCLEPVSPPTAEATETQPPPPTQPPAPTLDTLLVFSRCLDFITKRIVHVIPGLSEMEDFQQYIKITGKSAVIAAECKQDMGCTSQKMMQESAVLIAKMLVKNFLPMGRVILLLVDLLDPSGLAECAEIIRYVLNMVRELGIKGLNITATVVRSPANILIYDAEGRRTGFLPDGSIVEEIAEGRAVLSGEAKVVFVPANLVAEIELQGTEPGLVTLEAVHTVSIYVLDMAFEQVVFTAATRARLVFDGLVPTLHVEDASRGVNEQLQPTRLQVFEIEPEYLPTATTTATEEPTAIPTSAPPDTGDQAAPGLPFQLPCLGSGLLLLAPLALLGVRASREKRSRLRL